MHDERRYSSKYRAVPIAIGEGEGCAGIDRHKAPAAKSYHRNGHTRLGGGQQLKVYAYAVLHSLEYAVCLRPQVNTALCMYESEAGIRSMTAYSDTYDLPLVISSANSIMLPYRQSGLTSV